MKRKLLLLSLALTAIFAKAETPVLPIFSSDYVQSSGDEAWYYIRFDYKNGKDYYLYAQCDEDVNDGNADTITIHQKVTGQTNQLWKLSKKNASGSLADNKFLVISKTDASVYSYKTLRTKSLKDGVLVDSRPFYLYPHQDATNYASSLVVRDAGTISGGWNANGGVKEGTTIAWYDKTFKDKGDALSFHLYEYDRAVSNAEGIKYGTICLPVATTVSTDNNTKLYSISGFKSGETTKIYLAEETVTDSKYTLTAGQPYIFSTTATDKVTFTVATDDDADPAAASANNGLIGTLPSSDAQTNTLTQTSNTKYYVLSGNKWYKVGSKDGSTTTTFGSAAGRAYIDVAQVPMVENVSKANVMNIEEENTTGVDEATAEAVNVKDIYNLQGVNMGTDASALPEGIYMKNGRKFAK